MSGAGHLEIDHTADVGFEVWAPRLPGLYAEAVRALAEICYDLPSVRPVQERRLSVRGASPEERLVRWLQEVYLQLEIDTWLAAAASDMSLAGDEVAGTLSGEPYDPQRHTLHTEIKAITYHGLDIREEDGLWRATVVVDV
ncbi:MAG TPA: archease [Acidobacteriota bacterium]